MTGVRIRMTRWLGTALSCAALVLGWTSAGLAQTSSGRTPASQPVPAPGARVGTGTDEAEDARNQRERNDTSPPADAQNRGPLPTPFGNGIRPGWSAGITTPWGQQPPPR